MQWFFAVDWMKTTLEIGSRVLGVVGIAVLGWLWGRWQTSRAWAKKEFRTVLLVSYNDIEKLEAKEGEPAVALRLRTVFEQDFGSIFPHQAMRDNVLKAIEKTVEGDALLRFPKEDAWHLLNPILNRIAEMFAVEMMKASMDRGRKRRRFLFCLTYEKDPRMHQMKPRALLFDKDAFLQFPDQGEIRLESPFHTVRVEVIRKLKKDYQATPYLFLEIELPLG